MSQSPPPAPNTPPPPPQPLQQLWRQTQPVLKSATLTTLRGTIRVLQFAVDQLEDAPPALSADAPPAAIDAAAPQPIAAAPDAPPPLAPPTSPAQPASPAQPGVLTEIRLAWEQLRAVWGWLLRQIRPLLPANWNAKLSNTALTSIILGSLLLVFWAASARSPASSKAPEVAIAPSPPPPQAAPRLEPSPPPAAPAPAATPDQVAPPELIAPEPPAVVPPATAPAEAPVAAPVPPEPQPTPAPPPTPPPLVLTPEQSLIAAIQDEVTEVTSQYADGLIQSIQANFRSSRLIVRVGKDWYDLPRSRQDRLAGEMLKRAKELDFSKLEITDPQGRLLARSPVVGTEMIVLQRELAGSAAAS